MHQKETRKLTQSFHYRLHTALKKRRVSPTMLSGKTGISRSTIANYLSGRHLPSAHRLYRIAKALKVNEAWLLGYDVPFEDQFQHGDIPIYSTISCDGVFKDEDIEDYIALPLHIQKPDSEYFALYAFDDSLKDKHIHQGDLLVFEKSSDIKTGQIGCFCINGTLVIRILRHHPNGTTFLDSANESLMPIGVGPNAKFKVLGRLIKTIVQTPN